MDQNTSRGPLFFAALLLALTCSGFILGFRIAARAEAATLRAPADVVSRTATDTGHPAVDRHPGGGAIRRSVPEPVLPDGTNLLVRIPRPMPLTAHPGGGAQIGIMPASSRYYHQPLKAWVMRVSRDGRHGLVPVPYGASERSGWIRLTGLVPSTTAVSVLVDLSEHQLSVERNGTTVMRFPAATGTPSTPTPPGRYFVTDRVAFPAGGPFGTFAFGISGIQTHLPPGWTAGDQLAIHGTNAPASIGTSASAGCIRVTESALKRLEPLLRLGTPVILAP